MKKIVLFMALAIYLPSFAQENFEENRGQYVDTDQYKKDNGYVDSYELKFKDEEDKKNFRKLREFLREKEDICDAIRDEVKKYYVSSDDIKWIENKISSLQQLIKGKKATDLFYVPFELTYYDRYTPYYTTPDTSKKDISYVNGLITKTEDQKKLMVDQLKVYNNLRKNQGLIKQDIYKCQSQIDSALAPEYKQQDFRLNVSICFALLIGVLLACFFIIIYKRSDANLYKELLSGNGLQFVTLFVLIISIVVFGILGILEGKELSAILAGISGYILGKGVTSEKPNAEASINVGGNPIVQDPVKKDDGIEINPPA